MSSEQSVEAARNNIIRELITTERKYFRDFESMQEEAFVAAYKPWSVNWTKNALRDLDLPPERHNPPLSNCIVQLRKNLAVFNGLLSNLTTEISAFMSKPVSRSRRYPLLLETLFKTVSLDTYPHHYELQHGLAASKRTADRLNAACYRVGMTQTAADLRARVADCVSKLSNANLSEPPEPEVLQVSLFERALLFFASVSGGRTLTIRHLKMNRRETAPPLVLKRHVSSANILRIEAQQSEKY
ncbi:hypothetical protein C8R45DRAFT_1113097 [Mycena sanguinolenta]|nr:hypothetical protein C8R45DRAFT_1113097 [Mycena sanguinolenta]